MVCKEPSTCTHPVTSSSTGKSGEDRGFIFVSFKSTCSALAM